MLDEEVAVLHIGLDDIDTPFGGCTTELAAEIALSLCRRGIRFADYPNLIRLAPTVPWKTRGNGALALRVYVESREEAEELYMEVLERTRSYLEEHRHPESHPAAAMVYGEIPWQLRAVARRAVSTVLPLETIMRVAAKSLRGRSRHDLLSARGSRGLVGAYAAIGNTLTGTDYTYELITYREIGAIGEPRRISYETVKRFDEETRGETFLNIDPETRSVLISPHGPDPVLYGVRGETPWAVLRALEIIDPGEKPRLYMIYRTNQATDMHLSPINSLAEAYPYTGIVADVAVDAQPRRIKGGHVILRVSDGENAMDAAAYEPTGKLRDLVERLWVGDRIRVYGTVRPPSSRHPATINIEKIRVLKLAPKIIYEAPRCPRCGARMKSMGRNKGYRCPRCGYRDPSAKKIPVNLPRKPLPEWLTPPPRSYKHLMKPPERFGREKNHPPPPREIEEVMRIVCNQGNSL